MNSDAQQTCPVCEGQYAPAYLVAHIYGAHIGRARPGQPIACPVCGADGFLTDPAREFHRVRAHGYDPVGEAVALHRRREGVLMQIAREVLAEMNRTDENIAHPTHDDYLADALRRLAALDHATAERQH